MTRIYCLFGLYKTMRNEDIVNQIQHVITEYTNQQTFSNPSNNSRE